LPQKISVIQRFEYTFELSHKILRRFLAETESSRTEISEMFFNDIIRLGCKRGLLLNDLETWDKYRKSRNLTGHNYDEYNAENIAVIIPNCSAYLYGSRVQGKSVKYSDVDIALDYEGKPVPDILKLKLSSLFEKSILPYTVDIVDLNTVSPVFRAKVEKEFVKIL